MTCERCGAEITIGEWPFCPHGRGSNIVIQDSIEGGVLIRHGLCDEVTGEPVRYYSKTEINREAKRRGLVNYVATDRTPGYPTHRHTVS